MRRWLYIIVLISLPSCMVKISQQHKNGMILPEERRYFLDMIPLTFSGNNAEGYFSFDDEKIVFQSDSGELQPFRKKICDQIYLIDNIEDILKNQKKPEYKLISTGKGRTTCSFFLDKEKIIYSSTHHNSEDCPDIVRKYEGKYVWQLFEYDIYIYDIQKNQTEKLISGIGYEAEATVSPDGNFMVYTSDRSGDLELWLYEIKTRMNYQITNELGYDGGAFFDSTSKKIVWRASRPTSEEDKKIYKYLLRNRLVQPTSLNIYIMDLQTKKIKQVTNLPGANWSPYFYPDGSKILFSSNHHTLNRGGRVFNIFMIQIDGTDLQQITFGDEFESFPFFSYNKHNGHYWFLFSSNRNQKEKGDTNLFLAIWR